MALYGVEKSVVLQMPRSARLGDRKYWMLFLIESVKKHAIIVRIAMYGHVNIVNVPQEGPLFKT